MGHGHIQQLNAGFGVIDYDVSEDIGVGHLGDGDAVMAVIGDDVVQNFNHAGHIGVDAAAGMAKDEIADDAGRRPLRRIGDVDAHAIRRLGVEDGVVQDVGRAEPHLDADQAAARDDVVADGDALAAGDEDANFAADNGKPLNGDGVGVDDGDDGLVGGGREQHFAVLSRAQANGLVDDQGLGVGSGGDLDDSVRSGAAASASLMVA